MLNICVISQEFPPYTNWGGTATYYKYLVDGIRKLGHKATIISRYSPGAPMIEHISNSVDVIRVGSSIKRKLFLGRTIDKIIHARDVYKMVKKLDSVEPFDIIEVPEFTLEGLVLVKFPYFRNKMTIQCHGSNIIGVIPGGILSFLHRLDHLWSFKYELRILRNAYRITVPSKAGKDLLVKHGITDDKIKIIYHGIDTVFFNPSKKKLQSLPLEVGVVGKLHKMKGLDFVWKVIEKIGPDSKIRFHLIGDIHPSEKNEVSGYLSMFPNSIIYHHPVDHTEMPGIYHSLHVLLSPSRFEEFGFTYAEAMASELLVFAGKNGGGSEIIKHNETGFLVDPDKDVDFVIHKLKEVEENPGSFDRIRINARKNIEENFSLKTSIEKKIEYFSRLSNMK